MSKLNILVIEDDPQQASAIEKALRSHFDAQVQIAECELEFQEAMAALKVSCPWHAVVSDVMIPWSPGQTEPNPPDFRWGGRRCWQMFRQNELCKLVPWVYFTVLDDQTIKFSEFSDRSTGYAQKGHKIDPLLEEISELLQDSQLMRRVLQHGKEEPLEQCSTSLPE